MAREDEDEASGGEHALGCVILLIPVGIFMRGWALTMMWGWFVVPFGVMQIGMAHALGLSSCIALFHGISSGKSDDSKDKPVKVVGKLFCMMVLVPLIMVGIGWLCHYWM